MEEFEIKFLEVDVPELEKKLLAIGAKKVGSYDYSRKLFDYPDGAMNDRHSWIRVRTDGKETTLTYKQNLRKKLDDGSEENIGAKEIEVSVNDYAKTCELLKAMGLVVTTEEKNKRTRYIKDDVVFDIDSWPFIPTYLEIESSSHKKAEAAAVELGFDPKNGIIGSAGTVYKKYGFSTGAYSSITFEGMIKK
ncbi:MAG: CYTH domain-containing protein [Candidatus Paceibacterota bacterium]|jgi:adenylate cyclase class 2